jgi:hypothetical protein
MMKTTGRLPAFAFLSPKPHPLDSPHVILALGLAGLSLGQALQHGNGFLNGASILYLTFSIAMLGWGLFMSSAFGRTFFARVSLPALILGLIVQIYQLAFDYYGDYDFLSLVPTLWQLRVLVLFAGGLALVSLGPQKWVSPALRNGLTILVLITFWLAGVWVIRHAPTPFIDVYVFHQNSSRALLQGVDPYTLTTPSIYGDLSEYAYSAQLMQDDVVTIGNPYPPLSIYISLPGYLIGGDIRYSHLLAFVLSGALIAFLHPGRGSKLAAYVLLFSPRSLYIIEQSWTEPIVILLLAAVVSSAVHRPRWLSVLAGLFFASKQYLLFVFPLMLLIHPLRPPISQWFRRYVEIALVAIAVTAPLALWNLPAFLWNVGEMQWHQIFRLDALSYLAVYARVFEAQPSQWIPFVALAFAYFLVWKFLPRTPTGFAAAISLCLFMFFAFSKQAFCNYYFLVIGSICCAWSALQSGELSKD